MMTNVRLLHFNNPKEKLLIELVKSLPTKPSKTDGMMPFTLRLDCDPVRTDYGHFSATGLTPKDWANRCIEDSAKEVARMIETYFGVFGVPVDFYVDDRGIEFSPVMIDNDGQFMYSATLDIRVWAKRSEDETPSESFTNLPL